MLISIPFAKSESLDINKYVIGKALDGLFYMFAQEEEKIRKNPAARTADLLKKFSPNRIRSRLQRAHCNESPSTDRAHFFRGCV